MFADVRDMSSVVYLSVIKCFGLAINDTGLTLRLKVNLTGYWLVWQHYESHVAGSVHQTSLPLWLFKLNTHFRT